MQKQIKGIILNYVPYGERGRLVKFLTEEGVVTTGFSRQKRHSMDVGSLGVVQMRARLEQHLPTITWEGIYNPLPFMLHHYGKMCALNSAVAMILAFIPEGESHSSLYTSMKHLIKNLAEEVWLKTYVAFEKEHISCAGFTLDWRTCALCHKACLPAFISPKTGRYACDKVPKDVQGKLLSMPKIFLSEYKNQEISFQETLNGLDLTGYFYKKYLSHDLPEDRKTFHTWLIKNH